MREVMHTRLRFIRAKSVETIIEYVNSLTYKIEIKGSPVFAQKKWTLFFIPPDEIDSKKVKFGDID